MLKYEDVHNALSRVAASRLLDTPVEDLVMVALAVWHEGFVPDVAWVCRLDKKSQCVVGYTIEFLAGFNVLCHEEREKLLQFSCDLKFSCSANIEPDDYRDELATEWGLEHDLTPYFEHIAHFQTRHYKHVSEYERPSSNFRL